MCEIVNHSKRGIAAAIILAWSKNSNPLRKYGFYNEHYG